MPMICEILVALQGRVDAARLFGQRLEQILFKLGARRSTWDPKAYFFHFGPLTDTSANAQGTRGGPNIKWAQKRAVGKSASQLSCVSLPASLAAPRAAPWAAAPRLVVVVVAVVVVGVVRNKLARAHAQAEAQPHPRRVGLATAAALHSMVDRPRLRDGDGAGDPAAGAASA